MLDFTEVRDKKITWGTFADGLDREDLARLTNEMVDTMLNLIADCGDEDVVFAPDDPDAWDSYADDEELANDAWTLGHVIVHTTASSEECAAIAAELARGVEFHGRSRSEVDWETVTTIAQCRERLEESRRMRLASLQMWPKRPYLDNQYRRRETSPGLNAVAYFLTGLNHDDSHLAQIAEIVKQSQASRI